MNIILRVLVVMICWSFFGITHLSSLQSQTSTKPAETVQRLFEMLGKEQTEGIEKFFLLPPVTSDPETASFIDEFKRGMAEAAREYKKSGGIKSVKILKQELVGEHAELNVELTLGDGKTITNKVDLVYVSDEWKIDLTRDLIASGQAANETAAIKLVQAIAQAEILYSVTKGHGQFADLATLGRERLIDSKLASGEMQGYLFTSSPVLAKNRPPMFDITAKPKSTGTHGTGNRSFYCNETLLVYEAKGGVPPMATTLDRVPKSGSPMQ